MKHRTARRALFGLALAACVGGTSLYPWPASAEQAWVRDEIRLNVRTAPSVENRIVGVVKTGDEVQVLERGDGWTKVRNVLDGRDGWIPEGYLDPEAPPGIRLEEAEKRAG